MASILAYVLIAVLCWLTPTRVLVGDDFLVNVYPVRLLGLVSALLAGVHWSFSLRGLVVLATALCWAFAATTLASFHAASMSVSSSGWERLLLAQGAGLALSAFSLVGLAIQLLQGPVAAGVGVAARSLAAAGVLMVAGCYGRLALLVSGFLESPQGGLAGMSREAAGLSIGLVASSVPLALGAIVHQVARLQAVPTVGDISPVRHSRDGRAGFAHALVTNKGWWAVALSGTFLIPLGLAMSDTVLGPPEGLWPLVLWPASLLLRASGPGVSLGNGHYEWTPVQDFAVWIGLGLSWFFWSIVGGLVWLRARSLMGGPRSAR